MSTDSSWYSDAYPNLLDESEKDQIHKVCRIYWPESQEYADDAEPHVKRRESGLPCAIIVLCALLCQLPPTGREKLVLQPGVNAVLEAALLLDSDESMRLARMAAGSGSIGFRSIMESTEMLTWSFWRLSGFGGLFSPPMEALATRGIPGEDVERCVDLARHSLLSIEAPIELWAPDTMTEAVREACDAVINKHVQGAQIWSAQMFMRIRFNARNMFDPLSFSLFVAKRVIGPGRKMVLSPTQEYIYQCFAAAAMSSPDSPTVQMDDFDRVPMPAPIGSPWAARGNGTRHRTRVADTGVYMLYFKRNLPDALADSSVPTSGSQIQAAGKGCRSAAGKDSQLARQNRERPGTEVPVIYTGPVLV